MKKFLPFLLLLLAVQVVFGQTYPDKPNPAKLVNDYTNTLSAGQKQELEAQLVAFDNKTSNQVAVVIVETINGGDPTDYANELIRKWGIGNKENNGVLLLVVKADRKLSIVPGYGLEGALPDATCQAIIDNDIVPSFKANDYYGGISKGAQSIMQATQGAYTAPKGYDKRGERSGKGGGGVILVIIIIVVIFLMSGRGGGGGGMMSRRGYRGVGNPIWWLPIGGGGGFGGGGGGGFSGGGGGFGGFGGGSSGGGGASGSW